MHTHTHAHTYARTRAPNPEPQTSQTYTASLGAHTHTHTHRVTHLHFDFTDLVNVTSKHFDGGASLHIAAANLSPQAARALVSINRKSFLLATYAYINLKLAP